MLRRRSRGRVEAFSVARIVAMAAAALSAACVTVPPPDLAEQPDRRPIILTDTARPRADEILFSWPSQFTVQVEVDEPSDGGVPTWSWTALLDKTTVLGSETITGFASGPIQSVEFDSLTPPDPTSCHTVDLLVAHAFLPTPPHTPDSVGGDDLTWFYMPGGGPIGCPSYDGGLDSGVGPAGNAPADGGDP
jgi:hypothetical protein